ncbi:hypothetical protein FBU59_003402 [Linderina macrospora]|uniref:Uncharacterized protein n=1 Tax=Linderina macrospora TaxID=4868 RepID=A0ACC1J8E8_9FUNG|nr:hypothetical protein FBU59_003402 [Linderina macrospora]
MSSPLIDRAPPQKIPLIATDWSYTNEGNENIVFTYTGNDTSLCGWLLRLTKTTVGKHTSVPEPQQITQKQDSLMYTSQVIGDLVGSEYILPQRLVSVTEEFVGELNKQTGGQRPDQRMHKQIDLGQRVAMLTCNMLSSGMVTVEVKPKWGYLPGALAEISGQTQVKLTTCRYCMHQRLKHSECISGFCPLDLYSNDKHRVVYAIECLVKSPQNNLRVFLDGQPVEISSGGGAKQGIANWDEIGETVAEILVQEKLLARLKKLQRNLDRFDIEGLVPRYERALAEGKISGRQPEIGDWLGAERRFTARSNADADTESDKQAVLEFLLATTLKDISVLIQLPSSGMAAEDANGSDLPWKTVAVAGRRTQFRMAIIDADPKKLSKIPDYLAKDQEIVLNYLQVPDGKRCVE